MTNTRHNRKIPPWQPPLFLTRLAASLSTMGTTTISRYVKKQIPVEALRWEPDNLEAINAMRRWLASNDEVDYDRSSILPGESLVITTMTGRHVFSPGDWVVHGIHYAEFYSVDPDVFAENYEEYRA